MEAVCVGGNQLDTVRTVWACAALVQARLASRAADKSDLFMEVLRSVNEKCRWG
jgi:hypothetical protein